MLFLRLFSKYQVITFFTGSLLLLGSSSTSVALTLATMPPELESNSTIPLKKEKQLTEQRQLFVDAEKALKRGHFGQYKKMEHRLNDYPLYPYLRFIELERNISNTSTQKIQSFLHTYHNTPLANKLYYRWMNSLARRGKSKSLVQYFRPTQNTRLLCHYANALHSTGKKGTAFSLMGEIWQTGKSLPKSCDPILKKWQKAGYMTPHRLMTGSVTMMQLHWPNIRRGKKFQTVFFKRRWKYEHLLSF